MTNMKERTYRMTARAEATEATGQRVIDGMLARLRTTPYERIRIDDIAADAGVTPQTVIRRFGSKAALMTTTVERELQRIVEKRESALRSTPARTIRALVEHYDEYGSLILKTYSEAPLVPGLPEIVARGRSYHLDWCRRAFSTDLAPQPDDATRQRRVAQILAICDATTWRILRIDGGLSPEQTELAISELLTPLLR